MEETEGEPASGSDVLSCGIAVRRRHTLQRGKVRAHERSSVLVRAVVRARAVLVLTAMLMTGWHTILVPMVSPSTVRVSRRGRCGLVVHRTVPQQAHRRLGKRTDHQHQRKKCSQTVWHCDKVKGSLDKGQPGRVLAFMRASRDTIVARNGALAGQAARGRPQTHVPPARPATPQLPGRRP